MKNVREMQMDKMLDCLSKIGFTPEQVSEAEAYFLGEGEMPDYKLSEVKDAKATVKDEDRNDVRKLFEKMISSKRFDDMSKLFCLLFQVYGVSMKQLFPPYELLYKVQSKEYIPYLPKADLLAVVADARTHDVYHISNNTYMDLIALTDGNCNLLKEAYALSSQEYCNGKMVLLTAYFQMQRKNTNCEVATAATAEAVTEAQVKSAGLFGGLAKIFGKKDNVASAKAGEVAVVTTALSPEDQKLFDEYVDMILRNIGCLFETSITDEEKKQIRSYISDDTRGTASRNMAVSSIFEKNKMSEFFASLLIGCAIPNYKMSYQLRSFIKLCANGRHFEQVLDICKTEREKASISDTVFVWQKDFMLDNEALICWCAKHDLKSSLTRMAELHSVDYIKSLKEVSLENYTRMVDALKDVDKGIYARTFKPVLEKSGSDKQRMIAEELIAEDVSGAGSEVKEAFYGFLMGRCPIAVVYQYQNHMQGRFYGYSGRKLQQLQNYAKVHRRDDFYKRCKAYIVIKTVATESNYYSLVHGDELKIVNKRYAKENVVRLFKELEELGVHMETQITLAMGMHDCVYLDEHKESLLEAYLDIFSAYLNTKQEATLRAFADANASGRYLGICVLGQKGSQYKEELFAYFGDTSKLVKETLARVIAEHEEWSAEVLEKLKAKKAAERETAVTILGKMRGDYTAELTSALELEKTKKISDLIRSILNMSGDETEGNAGCADDLVKDLHKGGRKRSLAWAYESAFPVVHFADEDAKEADEMYMQAILLGYSSMTGPKFDKNVGVLADKLNKAELALYMNELYDRWMEAGAEAKKKWVLYVTAVYGGADIVVKLQRQINEWAKNSRGAIAAEAVKSLALNDSPTALLVVDGIARKYKYKQVKTAAGQALSFAAKELGVSIEELADRIVPDLGFNENMERVFDYGERSFKVYITPALEVEIFDENDKKLKNMPAPGKKDDEAKAAEAYAEFKQMKKQMKTTVTNQKLRLELALTVNRKWKAESWKKLFVNNPIMHQFAISLIWGIYENGELKDTFRYMEDGSFNTVDEEEYEFSDTAIIGLVHPVELSDEIKKQWLEQLEDYEITQSVEQLQRSVYRASEEENRAKTLTRVAGKILNGLSLSGKLVTMGWSKGPAMDAGMYDYFERLDEDCELAVELRFSGAYIGDENDEVTVYDAVFYNPKEAKREGMVWGIVKNDDAISLGNVPARYFSEIVYQLEKATASSTETNENWMND